MSQDSLPARLAEIEQPQTADIRVGGLEPLERLWARPAAHRLIPAFVAEGPATLHGRWVWRFNRERRQDALTWAETIVDGEDPLSIERLARAGLVEDAIKGELALRPWQARRGRVEGADSLRAIVESRRGAVLIFPHLGPFAGLWEALAAQGFKVYVVRKRPAREMGLRGLKGARSAGILRRLEADGWRFLQPGGLFPVMRELLARGNLCMLAIDAASTAAVSREDEVDDLAMFKRGAASLAFDTDVPVVPVFTVRRRAGQRVWLADPLEPRYFGDPEELHDRAIAQVREVMREHLAQVYPHRLLTPRLVEQRQAVRRAKEEQRGRRRRAGRSCEISDLFDTSSSRSQSARPVGGPRTSAGGPINRRRRGRPSGSRLGRSLSRVGEPDDSSREEFFAAAGQLTPLVGIRSSGAEFLVRTSDTGLGRRFFARQLRPEMRTLRRALRSLGITPTGMFVDVGANIGTTTVPALTEHHFDRVVAIEPEPGNVRLLKANLALNDLDARAAVIRAAASNVIGEACLQIHGTNSGGHRIAEGPDSIRVRTVTLDSLLADGTLSDVGLLWLDVQGHEGHALAGARQLLEAGVPVVFEYHRERLERAGGLTLLRDALSRYTTFVDLRGNVSLPTLASAPQHDLIDILAVTALRETR